MTHIHLQKNCHLFSSSLPFFCKRELKFFYNRLLRISLKRFKSVFKMKIIYCACSLHFPHYFWLPQKSKQNWNKKNAHPLLSLSWKEGEQDVRKRWGSFRMNRGIPCDCLKLQTQRWCISSVMDKWFIDNPFGSFILSYSSNREACS